MHHSIYKLTLASALPRLQRLKKLSLTAPRAVISSSETPVFASLTALKQLSLECHTLEHVAL
jgi:hypothetical protein